MNYALYDSLNSSLNHSLNYFLVAEQITNCSILTHPQISIQISDLRSVVCKEACRTVALLAHRLGAIFAPLAELWLPTLFKLLGDTSFDDYEH